jgi:hypothetical protein
MRTIEELLPLAAKHLMAERNGHQYETLGRARAGIVLVELRAAVEHQGRAWWPWWEESELVQFRGRKDVEKLLKFGASTDAEAAHQEAVQRDRDYRKKRRTRTL